MESEDGVKDVAGKPRLDLIPYQALKAMAEVREYGNKKYSSPSKWYDSGVDPVHFIGAALRHLYKHLDATTYGNRSQVDEESGLPHLHHALTSLAMATALTKKGEEDE